LRQTRCTVEHVTEKSFSPRMSQVFGYASAVADQYGHNHIGTEHVLLGLLASDGGVARHVLEELGAARRPDGSGSGSPVAHPPPWQHYLSTPPSDDSSE
jgi:ClpA/ClpB-like protein